MNQTTIYAIISAVLALMGILYLVLYVRADYKKDTVYSRQSVGNWFSYIIDQSEEHRENHEPQAARNQRVFYWTCAVFFLVCSLFFIVLALHTN